MKRVSFFSDLIGLELISVTGGNVGDEEIVFKFSDGTIIKMFHDQCCCESVYINDIDGNIQDLVGGVVTQFDEVFSEDDGEPPHEYSDSWSWTFYNIATTKGFVNLRWLGESNGYYSERVDVSVFTGKSEDYCYALGEGWRGITQAPPA